MSQVVIGGGLYASLLHILESLATEGDKDAVQLLHHVKHSTECSKEDEEAYAEAAFHKYHKDGEIEVDADPVVSVSSDGGAYVSAWVWVYDKEAGIRREEERC